MTGQPLKVCAECYSEEKQKDKLNGLGVALVAKGAECGLYILQNNN